MAELRAETADRLAEIEYEIVAMLRDIGCTWETIGEHLGGISRQAAEKRFHQPRRRRPGGTTA